MSGHYEQVASLDGDTFDAYCALPASGSGPGVLLFQEVLGINDNMRGIADRLAGEGYVVLVPDVFWRLERRFERKDESGLGDGIALVQKLDFATVPDDIQALHAHLLGMPQCTGKVGATGFCLGGALTFLAAARSDVDGNRIAAGVPYYGSAINDMLGMVDLIACPMLFHYGAEDPFIPEDKVAAVESAIAGKPGMTLHRYAAGHAFSNWDAPSMYDQAAADEAWARTSAFFAEHLQ